MLIFISISSSNLEIIDITVTQYSKIRSFEVQFYNTAPPNINVQQNSTTLQ
mgnify:CR=1 FL=1